MQDLFTLSQLAEEFHHPLARVRYIVLADVNLKPTLWIGPTAMYGQSQKEIIREKLDAIKPRPRGTAVLTS